MLDLFTGNNINAEIANLGNHAILLDVREAGEYVAGHIPGAVNVPLSVMNQFCFPWNKDTAIRVYCLAGTRSRRAVRILQSKGFTNVKNIGGIKFYKGSIEK